MDTITHIVSFFDEFLKHAHAVSIALGLVISTGVTQFLKYPIRRYFFSKGVDPESALTPAIEVEAHRWTVRTVAVVAGAIATFATWPDGTLVYRITWSIAAGVACPALYSIVCHYVPWLGAAATADKGIGK